MAVKIALEHGELFAGLVLMSLSFIVRPRWLTSSSTVVRVII